LFAGVILLAIAACKAKGIDVVYWIVLFILIKIRAINVLCPRWLYFCPPSKTWKTIASAEIIIPRDGIEPPPLMEVQPVIRDELKVTRTIIWISPPPSVLIRGSKSLLLPHRTKI